MDVNLLYFKERKVLLWMMCTADYSIPHRGTRVTHGSIQAGSTHGRLLELAQNVQQERILLSSNTDSQSESLRGENKRGDERNRSVQRFTNNKTD